MQDNEISELAAQLEAAVAKDDAIIKFVQHGGGPDESYLIANRAGYLRLAALSLQAAVVPFEDDGPALDVDSSGIIHEDSDVGIDWLERREDFATGANEDSEYKASLRDKVSALASGVGCIAAIFVVVMLLLIGLATVLKWWF
jgi:hypothetical protein